MRDIGQTTYLDKSPVLLKNRGGLSRYHGLLITRLRTSFIEDMDMESTVSKRAFTRIETMVVLAEAFFFMDTI